MMIVIKLRKDFKFEQKRSGELRFLMSDLQGIITCDINCIPKYKRLRYVYEAQSILNKHSLVK